MNEKVHNQAAKEHFKIAEEIDSKFRSETDNDLKKGFMVVAAQNYFYASINKIEAVLARELEQHSFNHENRYRKLFENRRLFGDRIIRLFEKVDRDERNKVAYKAQNGKMYEDIKKLATLLNEK